MYPLEHEPSIAGRSRLEILARILNVAERATLKTHIMYKGNLSHGQLEKYLAFLGQNGMLQQVLDEETGSRRYKVTDKGIDFLRDYARFSNAYGQGILRGYGSVNRFRYPVHFCFKCW